MRIQPKWMKYQKCNKRGKQNFKTQESTPKISITPAYTLISLPLPPAPQKRHLKTTPNPKPPKNTTNHPKTHLQTHPPHCTSLWAPASLNALAPSTKRRKFALSSGAPPVMSRTSPMLVLVLVLVFWKVLVFGKIDWGGGQKNRWPF